MNAVDREERLDQDPLSIRLARIEEPAPPPELLRRVLAREPVRSTVHRSRVGAMALVAAALVVATALTAMTTPVRSYVGDLAAQMGLTRTAHDLAAVSSGGQTIRVTSGVDDGWVVVLNLRAEPGPSQPSDWTIGQLTATDANGQALQGLGWQGNAAAGGFEAMAMFRRPRGGARPGSAITLHDQPMRSTRAVDLSPAPGPGWTLRFAVPASPAPAPRPVPAPGRVAGVDVTFAEVRASDRYIVVVIDAVGPDEVTMNNVSGPASLTDPHGAHVSNMAGDSGGAERTAGGLRERWELYWPRQGGGTYHLVLGPYRGQRLDRDLVIH